MSESLFTRDEIRRPKKIGRRPTFKKRAISFGPEPAPTGVGRAVRAKALDKMSTERFVAQVVDAIHARLGLLAGRPLDDAIVCPFARLKQCDATCRCQGGGYMLVRQLVHHYNDLLVYIGAMRPQKTKRWGRGKPATRYHLPDEISDRGSAS